MVAMPRLLLCTLETATEHAVGSSQMIWGPVLYHQHQIYCQLGIIVEQRSPWYVHFIIEHIRDTNLLLWDKVFISKYKAG